MKARMVDAVAQLSQFSRLLIAIGVVHLKAWKLAGCISMVNEVIIFPAIEDELATVEAAFLHIIRLGTQAKPRSDAGREFSAAESGCLPEMILKLSIKQPTGSSRGYSTAVQY
jgi:hypothetical protein